VELGQLQIIGFCLSGLLARGLNGCEGSPLPHFPVPAQRYDDLALKSQWHCRGKEIFDYIDGAGELYLAFGYESARAYEYRGPTDERMNLEVYRYARPEDAYGTLTFDPTGDNLGVGQMSRYGAGLARVWHGHFLFRILAQGYPGDVRALVKQVAHDLVRRAGPNGHKPVVVQRLPTANRSPNTVQFFHTMLLLNHIYYLGERNLLVLGADVNGATAEYELPSGRLRLIVVQYPTHRKARRAWLNFCRYFLQIHPDTQAWHSQAQLEDGKWAAAKLEGAVVHIVVEAESLKSARDILGTSVRQWEEDE